MSNKAIIQFGFRTIWRIMEIYIGGCYPSISIILHKASLFEYAFQVY